ESSKSSRASRRRGLRFLAISSSWTGAVVLPLSDICPNGRKRYGSPLSAASEAAASLRARSCSTYFPSLACIRATVSSKLAAGYCNNDLSGQSGLLERPVFQAEERITGAIRKRTPKPQTSRRGQSRENAGITATSRLLAIDQSHRQLV